MVRIREDRDPPSLEKLVEDACARQKLRLFVTGWSRKTFDVHLPCGEARRTRLVARIESLAATSGEIRIFEEAALPFAEDLGAALENELGVKEAVIIRAERP